MRPESPQATPTRRSPDVTYLVLPQHYEAAIAADARRWTPGKGPLDAHARTVWTGRRVWRLVKGQEDGSMWQLYAYAGERVTQERERRALDALQHPIIDRYVRELARDLIAPHDTHVDTLYLRVFNHLQQPAASASERSFWAERWLVLREISARVWDAYVFARRDAVRGETADTGSTEWLEQMDAADAHQLATMRGGA
jgi:hypothetical protein